MKWLFSLLILIVIVVAGDQVLLRWLNQESLDKAIVDYQNLLLDSQKSDVSGIVYQRQMILAKNGLTNQFRENTPKAPGEYRVLVMGGWPVLGLGLKPWEGLAESSAYALNQSLSQIAAKNPVKNISILSVARGGISLQGQISAFESLQGEYQFDQVLIVLSPDLLLEQKVPVDKIELSQASGLLMTWQLMHLKPQQILVPPETSAELFSDTSMSVLRDTLARFKGEIAPKYQVDSAVLIAPLFGMVSELEDAMRRSFIRTADEAGYLTGTLSLKGVASPSYDKNILLPTISASHTFAEQIKNYYMRRGIRQ
ncbi:hypothetical protein [Bdellovibrio sp. HCB288]|uniref:hypothetical protein n=1 Tax=Bdellovibrio sp. HCB288 TaxID=3394355 RepID=UPI0039B6E980